ncbi:hypothetical protein JTB14_019818 [Gonioctena quinquepunctata]|nr:hypothetical protein JTB14_019818 [Gonioctena quinquepunctata]
MYRGMRPSLPSLDNILLICNLLGIAPPRNCTWKYKTYAMVLLTLNVTGSIYSALRKLDPEFVTYSMVIRITDQTANLFMTLAVTTTVVLVVMVYPKKIHRIRDSLLEFDKALPLDRLCGKLRSSFWISASFALVMVPTVVVLDSWVWVENVELKLYKYYIIRNIQYCQITAIVMLWFWMGIEIFHRFSFLNAQLKKTLGGYSLYRSKLFLIKSKNVVEVCPRYIRDTLRKITKYHNFLCEIVSEVNELFGIIFLLHVLFFTAFTVQYTFIMIFYMTLDGSMGGQQFTGMLHFVSLAWISVCWIKLLNISIAGHFVEKEGNNTITICYNLLNDMDMKSSYQDQLLKEELQFLSKQVANRKPCLRASGFYEVNFTMMGCIVSSVTSYIIIAVQFMETK